MSAVFSSYDTDWKLGKIGPMVFLVLMLGLQNHEKILMVSPSWFNSFDIFFRTQKVEFFWRGRQRERQKINRFYKQNNNLALASCKTCCTCLCLFSHECDKKMSNFAFYGGNKQATPKFYFSIWRTWIRSLGIQFQVGFAYIWQSKGVEIITIKTERAQIHF